MFQVGKKELSEQKKVSVSIEERRFLQRYELPHIMHYSLLEDREEFYRKEFDTEKVKRWLNRRSNKTVIAVIIGRHTNISSRKQGGLRHDDTN